MKGNSNTLPHVRNNNNKTPLAQRHSVAQVNYSGSDRTATNADGNGEPAVLARAKYDSSVNILYKDTRCNSLK